MGLFSRKPKDAPPAGPPPAEMRGRAAEITDPGGLGWEVVWEALKTEPPADDAATMTQELGLDQETDIQQSTADMPATEYSGTRHGRPAAFRMGVVPSGWRKRGAYEVEVKTSVAPFRAEAKDGRLVAEPGAAPEVTETFDSLAPAPEVWRELEIEGGTEGIVARRPVTAHPQGYVYDLWLIERLADQLGA
jgi:hypothetical protein